MCLGRYGLADVPSSSPRAQVAPKTTSNVLDPSRHVFGLPVGSSEQEIVDFFGEPDGYFRMSGVESVLFYGDGVAFTVQDNRMSRVNLASSPLINYELAQTMRSESPLAGIDWSLPSGVRDGTLQDRVREHYGDPVGDPSDWTWTYATDTGLMTLNFSRHTNSEDSDDDGGVFKVNAITVHFDADADPAPDPDSTATPEVPAEEIGPAWKKSMLDGWRYEADPSRPREIWTFLANGYVLGRLADRDGDGEFDSPVLVWEVRHDGTLLLENQDGQARFKEVWHLIKLNPDTAIIRSDPDGEKRTYSREKSLR